MSPAKRQPPERNLAPVAARYRLAYRKSGRLRYASGRDFQRALERAIRRGGVPVAFSAGFSPHPRISYTNTVQTGVASEAEYFELGLTAAVSVQELASVLALGLPEGFDIVEVVPVGSDDFPNRLQASRWEIELPGVSPDAAAAAVANFLDLDEALVDRLTKSGKTMVDVRAAVTALHLCQPIAETRATASSDAAGPPYAILQMVVRHVTPSVRPVDVLTALHRSAGLPQAQAPRICRLAQGPLSEDGVTIGDPLELDRSAASRA